MHAKISGGLACLALVSFGITASACEADGERVVWPVVSPLAVSASADLGESRPEAVTLSALVLLDDTQDAYSVCLDGVAVWVPRSQVAEARGGTASITPARLRAERPDLLFWKHRDGVSAFLDTGRALPDIVELRGDTLDRVRVFPVLERTQVERARRLTKIDIGAVLVAVHRDAVAAYKTVSGAAGSGVAPILVIDASPSAAGFSQRFLRRMGQRLRSGDTLLADVTPVYLEGDGTLARRGTMTLAEVAGADIVPNVSDDAVALATITPKLALAGLEGDGDKADLIVLAGGDVGVEAFDRDAFGDIRIVNVTPEQDTALASSVPDAAEFIAYGAAAVDELSTMLATDADFRPPLGERTADFDGVVDAQARHGFLAVLPNANVDGAGFANIDRDTEWVAVPMWTVLNADLFDLED